MGWTTFKKYGKFIKDNGCDIKLQHTLRDIKLKDETYHLDVSNVTKTFKTKNLILALDKTPLLSFLILNL